MEKKKSTYEDVLKTTAEHFLVSRFPNDEKKRGSSDAFQTILNDMLDRFVFLIIKSASLSGHTTIGRPSSDTTAVNVVPAEKYEVYAKYHAWVVEQDGKKTKDERDETFNFLKNLIGRKLNAMIVKLIDEEDNVSIRRESMYATISATLVFVDMFVEAVVAAQNVRGVAGIVSSDLLAAGKRTLGPIFFNEITYTHGGENGLAPVLPKRKPTSTANGGGKRQKKAQA